MKKIGITLVLLVVLSACSSDGKKTGLGTIAGVVGGSVIGHQIDHDKGRYWGAAIGGIVAYSLMQVLNDKEQEELANSTQKTADTGEAQSWENPDTGVKIETKVVSDEGEAVAQSGKNCRTIEQKVELGDGSIKTETVTLCQDADGNWKAI